MVRCGRPPGKGVSGCLPGSETGNGAYQHDFPAGRAGFEIEADCGYTPASWSMRGETMDPEVAALIQELRALRVGFGVQESDLSDRIRPILRRVLALTEEDSQATVREKVIARLSELIGELPEGMRELARTALDIGGSGTERYDARVSRLAAAANRSERTIKRRVDDAFTLIAERAVGTSTAASAAAAADRPEWHTSALRVALVLDLPAAEVIEQRRIVSHVAGLAEIRPSFTVTPPSAPLDPGDLDITLIYGGIRGPVERLAANRFGFRLELPAPLRPGAQHEFSYRLRLAREFAPHYVCTPTYPCDRFELRIRFGPDRTPARIWRLNGSFPLELADTWPDREQLSADRAGEVSAVFTRLLPNLSYGIGWAPA
jgi:hypothetical protein